VYPNPFLIDQCVFTPWTNKTIAITPQNVSNRIVMTYGKVGLSWAADGAAWKAAGTAARAVYDLRIVDANGLPIPFAGVADAATCKTTAKSWFTDGTDIWVNTNDGLVPDSNIIVGRWNTHGCAITGTSKFYGKNITFVGSSVSEGTLFSGDANVQNEVCLHGCYFTGGYRGVASDTGNALAITNIKNTYLFDCKAAYSKMDGFNYHFTSIAAGSRRNCLVVEFNCVAYDNGLTSSGVGNNGSSCHEGINIIRFNTNCGNTTGPVIADVNGCYSILVDCNAKDSVTSNSVYYFDGNTPPSGVVGKMIMHNCTHTGETLSSTDLFISPADFDATLNYSELTNLGAGSGTPVYVP